MEKLNEGLDIQDAIRILQQAAEEEAAKEEEAKQAAEDADGSDEAVEIEGDIEVVDPTDVPEDDTETDESLFCEALDEEDLNAEFKDDLETLSQIYDCDWFLYGDAIEGDYGPETLFFEKFNTKEELQKIIDKLLAEDVHYDDSEDDEESGVKQFYLNECDKTVIEEAKEDVCPECGKNPCECDKHDIEECDKTVEEPAKEEDK